MAAEQGVNEAHFKLGLMYASGEGVPQDYARAYLWLNLAAASSEFHYRPERVVNRDRAAAILSPAELAATQRLAAQCQESGFKDCGEPE